MIDIDFSIMNREDVSIRIERLDVEKRNPPNYFFILSFEFPKKRKYDNYQLKIALSPEQVSDLKELLEKEGSEENGS